MLKLDRCMTCDQPLGALMVYSDLAGITKEISRERKVLLIGCDKFLEGKLKLHFSKREVCEDCPDGCSTCDPSCDDCRKKLFGVYAKGQAVEKKQSVDVIQSLYNAAQRMKAGVEEGHRILDRSVYSQAIGQIDVLQRIADEFDIELEEAE